MTSELARTLKRITDALPGESPYLTAINGVILVRADQEKPPAHLLAKPALCVVAQGTKWTSFGDQRHRYGAGQALLVNVEMPSVGRVVQASADCPFLGVIIELDPYRVKATLESLAAPPGDTAATVNGSSVALATGSSDVAGTGNSPATLAGSSDVAGTGNAPATLAPNTVATTRQNSTATLTQNSATTMAGSAATTATGAVVTAIDSGPPTGAMYFTSGTASRNAAGYSATCTRGAQRALLLVVDRPPRRPYP